MIVGGAVLVLAAGIPLRAVLTGVWGGVSDAGPFDVMAAALGGCFGSERCALAVAAAAADGHVAVTWMSSGRLYNGRGSSDVILQQQARRKVGVPDVTVSQIWDGS